ncbi:hypothetical protein DL93DRAFT_2227545 [Clavulina sp. PMI_390]|nr:hypothetical protein DL93DRAFT_2227545 [Clavulina sp. PMI_390]
MAETNPLPAYSLTQDEDFSLAAEVDTSETVPRYESILDSPPLAHSPSHNLTTDGSPAYEVRHVFVSKPFTGGSYITLEFSSLAAAPESIPLFAEGGVVEGCVVLDSKGKVNNLREMNISVTGRTTALLGSPTPHKFDFTLLSMNQDLSELVNSGPSPRPSSRNVHSSERRSAQFRFALPKTFDHAGRKYVLPPSYGERAYITYEISVLLRRGGWNSNIRSAHAPEGSLAVYWTTAGVSSFAKEILEYTKYLIFGFGFK